MTKGLISLLLATTSPIFVSTAHAQETPSPTEEGVAPEVTPTEADITDQSPLESGDEAIVVTGSRLPQTDLVAPAQVTVLDRAEIEATGAQSVGELLRELPVASPSTSESAGRGNAGSANIALRGLSAVNTLVLVNGRRMLSNDASGTVDLNTIPFEAVERVEVLQNGASAIYGSDAVAGVVNLIMRRDFDGIQLKAGAGIASRGDLPSTEISGTYGKKFDEGGFVFNVSYRTAGGNVIADRPVSRDPDWRARGGRNFRDSAPLRTAFRGIDPANPTTWYILREGVDRGASLADFRPYIFPADDDPITSGNDGINYWEYESSASEIKQFNMWFAGHTEIAESLTAFVEASYNNRKSLGFLAPDYFDTFNNYVVDENNDYNTFGRDLRVARTLLETLQFGATRKNDIESNLYRVVGGLEGKLGAFNWELAGNFATLGLFNDGGRTLERARLQRALGDSDVCRTITGCVPIDLFGATGSVTPEMLRSITADRFRNVDSNLKSATANIAGPLFNWWAGPVNIALGAEYRVEGFSSVQDNDADKQTPTPPFEPEDRKVSEFYGELGVPLLRDLPLLHSLDLNAAARHSRYNQFGSTTNPQVQLRWRPIEDLMFRGSWGTAFRAPNFTEANPQQTRGFRPVIDPCATADFASFPGCGGVRAPTFTGAFVVSGGNPDLQPETADTYTLGMVFTPSFLPRFSLTVDAYRIDKKDIIGTADVNYIIRENALGTSFLDAVSRNPDNTIDEVFAIRENLLSLRVQGIDLGVEYTTPKTSWGRFNVRTDLTYLDSFEASPSAGSAPVERAGTYTTSLGTLAKWRGTGRATWMTDLVTASWGVRYVGGVENSDSVIINGEHMQAEAYWQHDLNLMFDVAEQPGLRFTIGVDNIFDRMPPWLEGNYFNGFDDDTFNSRGRFFYGRAEVRF